MFFILTLNCYPKEVELISEDFPPYFSKKMQNGGIVTEIINESFKAAKVDYELKLIHEPYIRAIYNFKDGKYVMHSGASWGNFSEYEKKNIYKKFLFQVRWALFSYNKEIDDKLEKVRVGAYKGGADVEILRKMGYFVEEKPHMDQCH